MHKFALLFSLGFFAFIVWVIVQANQGNHTVFFDWVRALPYGDKVGHFMIFGVLGATLTLAFKFAGWRLGVIKIYWGLTLVTGFVMVEELSQAFIPSRTLDMADFIANMAGIMTAAWLCAYLDKKQKAGQANALE